MAATEDPAGLPVYMIRPDLRNIPQFALPEGFLFRHIRTDEGPLWTDIWRDAEPYMVIADNTFMCQFGGELDAVPERCCFLLNERGATIGTISAWWQPDWLGRGEYGQIHWVALRPAYQGRGLGKAMMTHALNKLAQWHTRAYLGTQSKRIGPIKLYADFGFVPDMHQDRAKQAWTEIHARLHEERKAS
jgi:GNAT superfamily N-acetyltransferase